MTAREGHGSDRPGGRLRRARAARTRGRSAVPPGVDGGSSAVPAPAEQRPSDGLGTVRLLTSGAFTLGGVTGLISLLTSEMTRSAAVTQSVLSVLLVVSALVLWVVRPARRWLFEAAAGWSIALISVLLVISEPMRMMPMYYLWPVVLIAYFGSVRALVATYAWMVVASALAVHLNPTATMHTDDAIAIYLTAALVAGAVATMTRTQHQLRVELEVSAHTDPLTGLANRRSFNPRLDALVVDAVRGAAPLTVVMFDLDHFKQINDEHGHLTGDRALQVFATVLRAQSRGGDMVSRFGGEEFAVALPGAGPDEAIAYAGRVAAALAAVSGVECPPLSVSAGIASLTSAREGAESLIRLADEALYAAKAGGRHRAAMWSDGLRVGPRFGAADAIADQPVGSVQLRT